MGQLCRIDADPVNNNQSDLSQPLTPGSSASLGTPIASPQHNEPMNVPAIASPPASRALLLTPLSGTPSDPNQAGNNLVASASSTTGKRRFTISIKVRVPQFIVTEKFTYYDQFTQLSKTV